MNRLAQLIDSSTKLAEPWLERRSAWPEHATQAQRCIPSGMLSLISGSWQCSRNSEWRFTRVSSPKIEVVSNFLYPAPDSLLPLYAMEIVVLAGRPVVAVFDAIAVHRDERARPYAEAYLQAAHAEFGQLTNADDAPDWYLECRSGNDFFLRPSAAQLDLTLDLHLRLWRDWFARIDSARCQPDMQSRQAVDAYKDHHRLHSPGLPLMQKNFGSDWTEVFLKQYFFG